VEWIDLAQDRANWYTLVKTVTDIQVLKEPKYLKQISDYQL
jgi:hypothetical protein